jgi:hypothetical protein
MSSSDRTGRGTLATVVAAGAALTLNLVAVTAALAESPSPSPAGGDPRSAGQGPGLVGDPLVAIGIVVLIGIVALGVTLAYVRASGGPREP